VGLLSIAFQTDKRPEEYVEFARLSERAGFDTVSVYHDLFFQPAIHALLLMAGATERVRLGPAALNPYTLHPIEIAGQIAALDAASGGRAYLGLVRGTWLDELGIDAARPLPRIREGVEVIQRLLAGDLSGYAGEHFALAPGAGLRYEPVRRQVPLLIGTWAPRLAAYAGTVADEVKVGGTANPDFVPLMRERIGKDGVGLVVGAVCVVDEDGQAARRRARAEAALYFGTIARLDPTLEVADSVVGEVERLARAGDAYAAGALLPDELLDRVAFAGTPEQVVRQVEALFEAGASRVELGTPHGVTDRGGVELLARRVVPAFASTSAR
jgi:5,10-methylenetetrahydromethanopterin reductase